MTLPTQPEPAENITVTPNAYPVQFEVPQVTEKAEVILIEFKATARDPRNVGLTPLGWFTEGWRRHQTFGNTDRTAAGPAGQ
jgi:hypothetical protein